jgi:methyl-accepting chemotaxis protein
MATPAFPPESLSFIFSRLSSSAPPVDILAWFEQAWADPSSLRLGRHDPPADALPIHAPDGELLAWVHGDLLLASELQVQLRPYLLLESAQRQAQEHQKRLDGMARQLNLQAAARQAFADQQAQFEQDTATLELIGQLCGSDSLNTFHAHLNTLGSTLGLVFEGHSAETGLHPSASPQPSGAWLPTLPAPLRPLFSVTPAAEASWGAAREHQARQVVATASRTLLRLEREAESQEALTWAHQITRLLAQLPGFQDPHTLLQGLARGLSPTRTSPCIPYVVAHGQLQGPGSSLPIPTEIRKRPANAIYALDPRSPLSTELPEPAWGLPLHGPKGLTALLLVPGQAPPSSHVRALIDQLREGAEANLGRLHHAAAVSQDSSTVQTYLDAIAKGQLETVCAPAQTPCGQALLRAAETIQETLKHLATVVFSFCEALSLGQLSFRPANANLPGQFGALVAALGRSAGAIHTPIAALQASLQELSNGDLTTQVSTPFSGDFEATRVALNLCVKQLRSLICQVQTTTVHLAAGAAQVATGASVVADGTARQSEAIQTLATFTTEVGRQTRQTATDAERVNQLVHTARERARHGTNQMSEMVNAMEEIDTAAHNIGRIIKVIDEIAFQTNLLALNAAVEAARAGVHGRGFAVVAEEVRNLATRSSKAAAETTDMIERSVARVRAGSDTADRTAEALGSIISGVEGIAELMDGIVRACAAQARGIEEGRGTLLQIEQVVQTNAATAQQSAAAADEMRAQGERLHELVDSFRVQVQNAPHTSTAPSPTTAPKPAPAGSISTEVRDLLRRLGPEGLARFREMAAR